MEDKDKLAKADKGSLPFIMMDREDDALIVAELEGRILETWVYEFESQGHKVQGLSKVGIDQATRELAKKGEVLRELEHDYNVDPTDGEHILFTVKVGRYAISEVGEEVLLDTAIGAKRQWIKMLRKDGRIVPDPFWFEKGIAKAARNAKHRLIPEEIKAKILAFAKEKGKVRDLTPPKEEPPQPPKETEPPKSKKEKADWYPKYMKKVEELKKEFYELSQREEYYNILGAHGFEHANQVRSRAEAVKLCKALTAQLEEWKREKDADEGDEAFL